MMTGIGAKPLLAAKRTEKPDAVQVRHLPVHRHDIERRKALELLQGILAVAGPT